MLNFLYGSEDTEFIYQGNTFKISELLELAMALVKYAEQNDDVLNEKKPSSVLITMGSRQLLRRLGLHHTCNQKKLLDLLCFDLAQNKHYQAGNKLLFKRNNLIYLLNSRIKSPTLIKVIDKILANEVTVMYPPKMDRGTYFEECLKKLFMDNAVPFWTVHRNADKEIPEIDGMFLIDDVIFVYEAKASVKPESLVEAFNFLKINLIKAQEQIRERIKMLKCDKVKRQFVEKQTGLSFEGKIIQPLIICNHMFFSGRIIG